MIYVLNGLQDQTFLYFLSRTGLNFIEHYSNQCPQFREMASGFISFLSSNQPVQNLLLLLMLRLLKLNFFILWPVIVTSFNFLTTLWLFKRYKMKAVYAAIFTLSTFFWLKLGIHAELIEIWVLALFVAFLNNSVGSEGGSGGTRLFVKMTPLIVLGALISNYFGIIILVTYSLIIFSYIVLNLKKDLFTDKFLLNSAVNIFASVLIIGLVLFPYINKVYLAKGSADFNVLRFVRPYEDFVTFSLRPWYFLIPSPKNPIYGELSKNIVSKIQETGYFLADDYFPAEHSAAFFGYLFLLTFTGCLIFGYKRLDSETKRKVNTYLLTIFFLFLFTMPPYFTVAGIKIYTPGHLIAVFFPMFRVTARFSPMILLLMLLVLAEVVNVIHDYKPKFFKIFMPLLLIITLAETYVPPKITKYDKVPEPYVYMSTQVPMTIKFLVYPYSKSNESLFWMPDHKQCLMNVRGYVYEKISAEDLTLRLFEPGMLDEAKDLGVTHVLIYQPDTYTKDVSSTSQLELVEKFSDSALYKVK